LLELALADNPSFVAFLKGGSLRHSVKATPEDFEAVDLFFFYAI